MAGARKKHQVAHLVEAMEHLAPPHLAESWDNVGLLSGRPTKPLQRVLLAIDLTRAVHDEAIQLKADVLVTYHPPLFKPVKNLRITGQEPPQLAMSLLEQGVAIYSPHTALDVASGGTNDALAAALHLQVTGSFAHATGKGSFLKLVVFVPENAVDQVAEAVFAAGAGHIGAKAHYSKCSFRTPGIGTFQGDAESNPAVGTAGVFERAPEVRLETILPASAASDVVAAIQASHPYEEPAFDLLPLLTPPEAVGIGRYAQLAKPTPLAQLAAHIKKSLGLAAVQVVGNPRRSIRTVGLIAGSAGRLGLEKSQQAYDLLITGELKHHDMLAYDAAGIAVICLGHSESERPVLPVISAHLRKHLPGLAVRISKADRSPAHVL